MDQPRLLVIETSGRIGQVALAEGSRLVRKQVLDEARRHARDLAPAIQNMLMEEGWQPRDVRGVIVSQGPGSYTGLRVGIIAGKVFAYATGARLLAIPTFHAIAQQTNADVKSLWVLGDAQQKNVYAQRFERGPDRVTIAPATPLSILPFTDWSLARNPSDWVTGPAMRLYQSQLANSETASKLWDPQPETLLELGLNRFHAGQGDDPFALEPIYLRPSAAEEKWASLPSRP